MNETKYKHYSAADGDTEEAEEAQEHQSKISIGQSWKKASKTRGRFNNPPCQN